MNGQIRFAGGASLGAFSAMVVLAGFAAADNAAVVEQTDDFTDRRTLKLHIVADRPMQGAVGMVVFCGDGVRRRSVWFAGADVPRGDILWDETDREPGLFSDADEARRFGVHGDTAEFGAFPYPREAHVSMTYRFDQWNARRVRAEWWDAADGFAFFSGLRRTADWMALLEQSDTLIVKFGRGRTDRYDLLAARPAISDFKERCRAIRIGGAE